MLSLAYTALSLLSAATMSPPPAVAADGARRALEYAPAPVDNPLKGLVPYAGDVGDRFPHSLEFDYLPLSALMTGDNRFDWKPLEDLLDAVGGRGHQAVFRVFLEYPGKKNVIPEFLIRGGLKVHAYTNTNTQPFPPQTVETPDYDDARLRRALKQFIMALGAKYDGDPRIGFITAGLLGTWGEWHDWPRDDLFASREVQAEVMDAYETAFRTTPVLLRYPAGEGDPKKASNVKRRFGYHDDSFAWATLETGRKDDGWFFLALMRAAGPEALDKWKTRPIGGEIRPEAWGKVFDAEPGDKRIEDFRTCVEATHATWLMDSGLFQPKTRNEVRVKRAEEEVRRMGYELHVSAVTITAPSADNLKVKMEIENRGVAPFYYDWPVEFAILSADGTTMQVAHGAGKIAGLLPGEPRTWNENLPLKAADGGSKLALRVPNPLPKGKPVRFANRGQDADAKGWLTLGEVGRR